MQSQAARVTSSFSLHDRQKERPSILSRDSQSPRASDLTLSLSLSCARRLAWNERTCKNRIQGVREERRAGVEGRGCSRLSCCLLLSFPEQLLHHRAREGRSSPQLPCCHSLSLLLLPASAAGAEAGARITGIEREKWHEKREKRGKMRQN